MSVAPLAALSPMSLTAEVIGLATLLLALGLWLMLPRGAAVGRGAGSVLVIGGLVLFACRLPWLGAWAAQVVFYLLAAVTVLAAVATVTFRNPVYSAIWFGLSLLGTAGLFLFQGAQFLGVATVVVYAGAILVTFLFVLMLAQPEGQAFYDRISWGAMLSAGTGSLIVALVALTVSTTFQKSREMDTARRTDSGTIRTAAADSREGAADGHRRPPFDSAALAGDILADEHVARLGAQLFSKYLIAIEVAGTLLLVALVGTVAIVAQIRRTSGLGGPTHG